jgi:hypothetical protein
LCIQSSHRQTEMYPLCLLQSHCANQKSALTGLERAEGDTYMLNNVAPFQLLSNEVLFLKTVSRLRVLAADASLKALRNWRFLFTGARLAVTTTPRAQIRVRMQFLHSIVQVLWFEVSNVENGLGCRSQNLRNRFSGISLRRVGTVFICCRASNFQQPC